MQLRLCGVMLEYTYIPSHKSANPHYCFCLTPTSVPEVFRQAKATHTHTQVFPDWNWKEEALQQTRLPMHIPSHSLPCLLCSPLPPPLLSVCLSLSHSSRSTPLLSVGGWVHRPQLSLSRPTNIELCRTGGGEETVSTRQRVHGQFESLPTIRTTLSVSPPPLFSQMKQTFVGSHKTHKRVVCGALSHRENCVAGWGAFLFKRMKRTFTRTRRLNVSFGIDYNLDLGCDSFLTTDTCTRTHTLTHLPLGVFYRQEVAARWNT